MKALRVDGVKDLFVLPADKESACTVNCPQQAYQMLVGARAERMFLRLRAYQGIWCFFVSAYLANAPMKGELSIK